MQTTLTRIFIDLKSVSDGLSKFETKCLGKIENSNVFSAQNQVISKKKKKKKVFAKIQGDFSSKISQVQTFQGGLFSHGGGLFSIFHRKSASKAQKTRDFAYFTSQWGGLEPPPRPPPWLRYCNIPKIKIMDFVECWYNFHWWVGLILSVNEPQLEADVKFMSPQLYMAHQHHLICLNKMTFILFLTTKLFAQLTLLLLHPVDESTNFLD